MLLLAYLQGQESNEKDLNLGKRINAFFESVWKEGGKWAFVWHSQDFEQAPI